MKENLQKNRPIGVFDSGIGGLSVVRALKEILPYEDIVYLGDTARLPYGTKSKEVITKFAFQDAGFLLSRNVKMVIVACHTVSSVAMYELSKSLSVPVLGVIEPGAKEAVRLTKNNRIGVIGTPATIQAGEYERAIRRYRKDVEIIAKSTPLFVPLVEEGWIEHPVTEMVIREYLLPLKQDGIDTLLLGCTHYPLLKKPLKKFFGEEVKLVDPGYETAKQAKDILAQNDLLREEKRRSIYRFYLTDLSPNFKKIGENFLGEPIGDVIRASLQEEE